MSGMNMRLQLNTEFTLNRFNEKYRRAQKWLDNEVLKDSDPYVPMRTGNLRNSGIRGTNVGSGRVIYNAPYASKCYYGHMNFSKAKHPQACRQWFEKAKAANKAKWIKGSKGMMKE
jgi:hypothetical protein